MRQRTLLKKGQIVRFTEDDPDLWEVLRVTECSATVRCMTRQHREFETVDGTEVDFDAPGRKTTISPHSNVEIVQRGDNGDNGERRT